MKRKKPKPDDLVEKMYAYFTSYEDRGLPSFTKFARQVGLTTAELVSLRRHKYFDRVFRECEMMRRDYLIDRALDKRFDPSLAKFILTSEGEEKNRENTNNFVLQLTVKE